ncbi:hypothetical protein FA95DRAFT_1562014 [Auriscalpium vulgare]|uniref:Uncharacterized protein n=1 Tax=Auriscalpium vulgare TaxID=40419 RepID=A0ACB8RLZ5_9AGAM|nr:hypothetical protein FA95DRAFT_1562014 [Auriscalpium vulgare]
MDSIDSNFPPSGSRLLSESPLSGPFVSSSSASHTGTRGDDLSLSELSIPEPRPPSRPFSLLAQPQLKASTDAEGGDEGEEEELEGTGEDEEKRRRLDARTREERLQNDLFVLRKLNNTFAIYNDALSEAQSATERVAAQLEQTNALLDKYVGVLSRSEQFTRLVFDERWQGAEADLAVIEEEERVAAEKHRREEEERLITAQRERERKEAEERERAAREEKEREERERREKQPARGSGVRGVRGTRASMRGSAARGVSRAAAGAATASNAAGARGRGGSAAATQSSKIGRPSSVASTRGTSGIARGVSRRPA